MFFNLIKLVFVFSLALVAVLLFTNHFGVAIKVTNYIFALLVLTAVYKLIKKDEI